MSLDEPVAAKRATQTKPILEKEALSAELGRPLPDGWTLLATDPPVTEQTNGPTTGALDSRVYAYGGGAAASTWIYVSSDGGAISWDRFLGDWAPLRDEPAGAIHQGALWLTGGSAHGTATLLSDTWRALPADPGAWTKVDDGAAWGGRWGHKMLPFNGRLYLMGGLQDNSPRGDVWILGDDDRWTQIATEAFTPRSNFAVGVVGGQMLVIGGFQDPAVADCAVSSDGVHWTTHPAPWAPRGRFAAATIGDTLYILGGLTPRCDLWSTKNGVDWKLEDDRGPWDGGLSGFGMVAVGDHLVVFGGVVGGSDPSVNRQTWAYKPSLGGWSVIARTQLFAQLQHPVVERLAGVTYALDGARTSPVVRSTDNANWTTVGSNLLFRSRAAGCVHRNQLWVTGGIDDGGHGTNEVYSSVDGVTWSPHPTPNWMPRKRHAMAVFQDMIWLIGGDVDRLGLQADVWSTTDGGMWAAGPANAFPGRCDMTLVAFAGTLWAIGGLGVHGVLREVYQLNPRTQRWSPAPTPPWSARRRVAAGVLNGELYITLGVDGGGTPCTDTWKMTAQGAWSPVSDVGPPPFAPETYGPTIVDGPILAIGVAPSKDYGVMGYGYQYRPPAV